jgi:hypothetical protein
MLGRGELKPESAMAGWRYGRDWALAHGKGRSNWRLERAPEASGVVHEHDRLQDKIEAAGHLRAATEALDALPAPCAWGRPTLALFSPPLSVDEAA